MGRSRSANSRVGSQVEGPVTKLMKFGAFVQIAEGIEGLVHVSEIVAERRINHPQDVLHAGQVVKAQVLAHRPGEAPDQAEHEAAVPTSIDEYIAEHKAGDVVSGRVVEESGERATVELGEGIRATCRTARSRYAAASAQTKVDSGKADLSSLSSMLQARWKGECARTSRSPNR